MLPYTFGFSGLFGVFIKVKHQGVDTQALLTCAMLQMNAGMRKHLSSVLYSFIVEK
jgi:hypothetical protein